MSWDDVIIGKGDKGCAAILCIKLPSGYISENGVSYWIMDAFYGIGMTIFKNTKEGIALNKMLDDKSDAEKIMKWLQEIVFKNIDAEFMSDLVKKEKEKSFEEGRDSLSKDIKELLGL